MDLRNCSARVKKVCTDILNIPEADTHLFASVKRVGPKRGIKPRPFLATYHYFSERDAVRLKSNDKLGELKTAGNENWSL